MVDIANKLAIPNIRRGAIYHTTINVPATHIEQHHTHDRIPAIALSGMMEGCPSSSWTIPVLSRTHTNIFHGPVSQVSNFATLHVANPNVSNKLISNL